MEYRLDPDPGPVRLVASNGALILASKGVLSDSSSFARLVVYKAGFQSPWSWGQTPPEGPDFEVRWVAANTSGYVYVGGWSDGAFDGEALPGSAPGGWLTGFYVPTP